MKRILCISLVLVMLLVGCGAEAPALLPGSQVGGVGAYGVYKLDFSVRQLSGWLFTGWDFAYRCNAEEIKDGQRVLFPVELFSFCSIQAEATERGAPENVFTATVPVAICHGGSGKTETTVTDRNGRTATFKVSCTVTKTGEQEA